MDCFEPSPAPAIDPDPLPESTGPFPVDISIPLSYKDLLMLRMLHKHEISVTYLPRVITKMRTGGQSNVSLKNRFQANIEDRKAWEINGLKPGPLTLYRKPLSKISQYFKK